MKAFIVVGIRYWMNYYILIIMTFYSNSIGLHLKIIKTRYKNNYQEYLLKNTYNTGTFLVILSPKEKFILIQISNIIIALFIIK